MPALSENWPVFLPCVMGFGAIFLLLPQARRARPVWGVALSALALIFGAVVLIRTDTSIVESVLFFGFAGIAIAAGVMMISQSNPVHAALSFALVVVSTCGLFLLLAAPFLMAATIIIYAGAIVVTFLFVIMLAQQEGVSNADQRSREPLLASLACCVLLGSLLCVLNKTYHPRNLEDAVAKLTKLSEAKTKEDIIRVLGDPAAKKEGERTLPLVEELEKQFVTVSDDHNVRNDIAALTPDWLHLRVDRIKEHSKAVLKELQPQRNRQGSLALHKVPGKAKTPGHFRPGQLPASNVAAIGKSLFTDYLIPVELAATLLLVATIGAIAIAVRRSEELR